MVFVPLTIRRLNAAVIPLTRGKYALVDPEDWAELSRRKWCFARYAKRGKGIYMHRQLLGFDGPEVDHINGNKLDNRRGNLRHVSKAQNNANSRKASGCSSRFKGVCWDRKSRQWQSYIADHGKQYHLGFFATEAEAARAYNEAAVIRFGEFARLNQIAA